jgi:predicted DNA-binding transcriptional regulator YafY
MYFIDKKVRERTFPTTVSLASDYEAKYGKSVDSRTIAADIAALKEKFRAPLEYDYEKRGYFYTDPYFQLPVLKEDPDNLLPAMAEERHPRTAAIPEWQRRFIAALADKLLPLQKGEKRHEKASVLLESPAREQGTGAVKTPLLQALEDTTALDIRYMEAGKKAVSLIFNPLHLICSLDFNLVFGIARKGEEDSSARPGRYRLLYLDRIREAIVRQEPSNPPAYVYIQTTGSRDIEVVLAREHSDLLLVFTLPPEGSSKNPFPEYTLLVQAEIFAQR